MPDSGKLPAEILEFCLFNRLFARMGPPLTSRSLESLAAKGDQPPRLDPTIFTPGRFDLARIAGSVLVRCRGIRMGRSFIHPPPIYDEVISPTVGAFANNSLIVTFFVADRSLREITVVRLGNNRHPLRGHII